MTTQSSQPHPLLGDGEQLVVEARLDDLHSTGDPRRAPVYLHLTLSGQIYRISFAAEADCVICQHEGRRSTSYAEGSTVLLSRLHDHFVVREVLPVAA